MNILIPAFEPNKKLIKLVKEIKEKTNYKIVIVDDGSGKKYTEIFLELEKLNCEIIGYEKNLGKGEALKIGFNYIISKGEKENVVCADCDGQHKVDDIIKVAKAIENENQIVLGVRKFKRKVPLKSRLGNYISAITFFISTGRYLTDTQTGLRGYPYNLLNKMCLIEGSRYDYEFNILLNSKEYDITFKEVQIETVYENNNKGSHFRPIKDSALIYLPVLKFCSSSIIAGIFDFILLFVFKAITANLFLSVVLSRILSSTFNYLFNKEIVFKENFNKENKEKYYKNNTSAFRYFGLVIVIMFLNYFVLSFMINVINIPDVFAKVLTETILFVFSYLVQKKFVFKCNKKAGKTEYKYS